MKGYTIQHSIELLERQAGSGSGASTASQVSFDNTDTDIVATNVQNALVEINTKTGDIYSETETKIGKWKNKDLYRKIIEITTPQSTSGTSNTIAFDMSTYLPEADQVWGVTDKSWVTGESEGTSYTRGFLAIEIEDNYLVAYSPASRTNVTVTLTVEYTKAASSEAKSTRKKSSK